MPAKKTNPNTGKLMVNVYDGTRQLISTEVELLVRIIDGNQRQRSARHHKRSSIAFRGLPFFDNFGDNYTVIVSAKDYWQAGFRPVKLLRNAWQHVDLMLLPKDGRFNFTKAQWEVLQTTHPRLVTLLSVGTRAKAAAKDRYADLIKERPDTLAALLNIMTALEVIQLPIGTPLDYLKKLLWEEMAQDRFFAYAGRQLIEQVERAAREGLFEPEVGSGFFHPGATRSYKQVQFGEANVQITFHEGNTRTIEGEECVKVELDMDYYKNHAAHALLEVLPNTVLGRLTDPRQVYMLRWIAGRSAGVPEFNPPYVIV